MKSSPVVLVRETLALPAGLTPSRRTIARRGLRVAALLASLTAVSLTLAPPAEAQPPYQQGHLPGLAGFDVGDFRSTPTLADLDADGDLDLLAGDYLGELRFFPNTGSSAAPAFSGRTGSGNPFDGVDVGYYSAPALGDLDGDGDLDAVVSGACPPSYFLNTGSSTTPLFLEQTGTDNPFSSLAPCLDVVSTTLGDLDGDGDLDAVVGEFSSSPLRYLLNTGGSLTPVYTELTGTANPFSAIDPGSELQATLGDLDGDGDLDAVVGESGGTLRYLRNTGSSTTPVYTELTGVANPVSGFNFELDAIPALGDLDGDGDLDVVVGETFGTLRYLANTGSSTTPGFIVPGGTANPVFGTDLGRTSAPALGDLDGDGDVDAVVGERYGTLRYYRQTGSSTAPVYAEATGTANPLAGVDVGLESQPALGDLDGDGDLDAVIGDAIGDLHLFANTGSSTTPVFVERTGTANPFTGLNPRSNAAVALVDLDADGDLDAVLGGYDYYNGPLAYFANTGSSTAPAFIERTGAQNPFDDVTFNGDPALADLDLDGDLDLVLASNPMVTFSFWDYYENTGSPTIPAFVNRTGTANPFSGFDAGYQLAPALADLDADGDVDLVAGEEGGSLSLLRSGWTLFTDGFESGDTSAWSATLPDP